MRTLHFTKMEGCGNDYVYVNGFAEKVPQAEKPALVRRLSDRHFGIGGDGVIFINPIEGADAEMEMYNADGTRGEMCGNGIRCVAKYVADRGIVTKNPMTIISYGQTKILTLTKDGDGKTVKVRVNRGSPILETKDVPTTAAPNRKIGSADAAVSVPITVRGKEYEMTCVSMGNPHAVVFVDDVEHFDVNGIGPDYEHHALFPKRVNTEFVQVVDESHVKMRVYERGTGETLACGTGACATAVACILNGKTGSRVEVELLGGTLSIEWDGVQGDSFAPVFMTGPATEVFSGEIEY